MLSRSQGWIGVVLGLMGLVGCAGSQPSVGSEQAHLGRGIVEGTKGYQQLQDDHLTAPAGTPGLQGQVLGIEGGAYLIRDVRGVEVRLPLDENTRIDRPAHVGDWVEAYLDQDGRAVSIRNIDEHISLE